MNTAKRPFVLIWEVTQACDLVCEHCRADAQPDRHPDELSTAEARKLLDEAREFGEGQIVVLSGGDPMKRDDIFELVEYGDEIGLSMTMTPSGTSSLDREAVNRLASLRRIALSIVGAISETQDSFRGEAGSFDETVQAARYASQEGIPLQINTTVCAQTVDELPQIRELVADLGAVLWSVFFLVPVGRGATLEPISPERAEGVMEWLHEVSNEADFGIKTTEAPHYRRVVIQNAEDDEGTEPPNDAIGRRTGITAGDGFAFVSHTGEVFPSGFLPLSAGNVRDESVVEIYRDSRLFDELRDPDALKGKCGVCEFRNVCGGSRSRAYAYTGDPLESDPLCAYVPDDQGI
ncbi:MAG: TIGR04053 family radical SAM/SPASM domain-containing protein [Halobacteria archaeon]|nr:TIGR04053 family radical SAM/SPASM domain-containing protein [Halobacteria archaeon]